MRRCVFTLRSKQYVFVFQTQFVIVLIHTTTNIINQNECAFPQFLNYIVVGQAMFLIVLFTIILYIGYMMSFPSFPTKSERDAWDAAANGYNYSYIKNE